MKPLARRTKKAPARFTETRGRKIVAAVASGSTLSEAAKAVGLGRYGRKSNL